MIATLPLSMLALVLSVRTLVGQAWSACPASPATLEQTLDEAQAAFSLLDTTTFFAATDEADREAGCLNRAAPPALVARLHRLNGLRAFTEGSDLRATLAFAAARAVDPDYRFPAGVVPADHPVRGLYEAARDVVGATAAAAPPATGALLFDGRVSPDRPTGRPTLAQLVTEPGVGVLVSAYLWPGDAMFPYEAARNPAPGPAVAALPGPAIAVLPVPPPAAARRARPGRVIVPLLVTAAASGAAAGTCYALAYRAHSDFWSPATAPEDLDGLRSRTNALYLSSVGLGAVAVGTSVLAVVAWRW